jgi:dihydrofolate reductase
MNFDIILATDDEGGIGKDNSIPWYGLLPEDMAFFRCSTADSTVIMGRKTWESIGSRPLPGRVNIVITSNSTCANAHVVAKTLDEALDLCPRDRPVFVMGGKGLYEEAFEHPDLRFVYHTRVAGIFGCDVKVSLPAWVASSAASKVILPADGRCEIVRINAPQAAVASYHCNNEV